MGSRGSSKRVADAVARPRDAASLVVLRERAGRREVLMGRRRSASRFMPDFFVFPGGVVEAGDAQARPASELGHEALRTMAVAGRALRARALAMAAVRETFEETGLILGVPGDVGPCPRGTWRTLRALGLAPALARLDYVGRAITPTHMPLRFHARFFVARERFVRGRLLEEEGELADLGWIALAAVHERRLARVTAFMLEQAVRVAEAADSAALARPVFAQRSRSVYVRYLPPANA